MNRHASDHDPRSWRLTTPRTPEPEPDGMELASLFAALWRNKWLILACIAMAGVIAYSVLRTVRPSYYSFAEVLLDTRQERVVGVEQVTSDLTVTNSVVAGEIAVMRSNILLGQVVDDLGLMQHPDFDPRLVAEPGLVQQWADAAMAALGLGEEAAEPMPSISEEATSGLSDQDARNIVIWQVRRNLSVYQSGISYVISISVQAHDPDIAAAIANAVAAHYIQDQLAAKLAATQRAIAWLDNRLIELEGQLRNAEDAVVEFRAQQVLEEGGDEGSVAQQLTEMNRAIVAARTDRAAAEARLAYVQRLAADGGPEAAAATLSTPRLGSLDAELANLERQRAQLSSRLGPRHPEMLSLKLAIDDLLRDRGAAIRSAISDLEAAVAQALGRETAIRDDIVTAQLLQVQLSRSSVRLSQLGRAASAMRQVYESFLARFQETTQQLEFQRADARVITEAQPSLAPSRPRTKLILAVALVLGAILGVVVSLIRAALDFSVRNPQDLARQTGLPVLGVLPLQRSMKAGWQQDELRRPQLSRYAEGLRQVRFGLMGNASHPAPGVVMLTAAERGVGTSTTVLGLSRAMAAIGRTVVILDANFRQPDQAKLLAQAPTGPRIEHYLVGSASVDQITMVEVETRLSLVPAGSGSIPTADILSAPRFGALIEDLRARHDVVLIDAPHVMGHADATILASLADAVVVLVRAERSRRDTVTAAIDALEKAEGHVLGTVLTHARNKYQQAVAPPNPFGRASPRPWHANA